MPKAKAKAWCFNLTWKLYYTSKNNSPGKFTSSKSTIENTKKRCEWCLYRANVYTLLTLRE